MVYILPRSKAGTRVTVRPISPDVESNGSINILKAGWGQSIRSKNKSRAFYEAIYGKAPSEGMNLDFGAHSPSKWLDSQDVFFQQAPVVSVAAIPEISRETQYATLIGPKAPRKVLSEHKLTLLDSLSTPQPPANILEILSAGRQPLPPALARALAARDSPKKPALRTKVRHGLLSPPPPSGFPRPLRPVNESASLGDVSAGSMPQRKQAKANMEPTKEPSTAPSGSKLSAGSFLKFSTISSSSSQLSKVSAVTIHKKVANMRLNSYFASNGASGVGGIDMDALSRLFDRYRG